MSTSVVDGVPPKARPDARQRITEAALDLFEDRGYAATTVDAIAERAGISRRTFFHHFTSKDAVVFPDHAALIDRLDTHLHEQVNSAPVEAIGSALRLVLQSYLADPALALRRYHLTRANPELREREISWVQRYQLMFSHYLGEQYADEPRGALTAEAVAASLVAVHNHVLRQWLKRDGDGDALSELDDAVRWFAHSTHLALRGSASGRVVVAVFDEDVDPATLAARIAEARGTITG